MIDDEHHLLSGPFNLRNIQMTVNSTNHYILNKEYRTGHVTQN